MPLWPLLLIINILWAAPPAASAAETIETAETVSVSLFSKYHPKTLLLEPLEPYTLQGAPGAGPLKVNLIGKEIEVNGRTWSRVELSAKEPWLPVRINKKHDLLLPGKLTFHHYEGEIAITGYIDIEEYVAAVVQYELGQGPPAALAAQAILVRTFIAANRLRHAARGADLCDLTHCQVYRAGPPAAWALAAAESTKGQILINNKGQPAEVFYSSTCGGETVAPGAIWPGSDKNLVGIEDYLPGDKEPLCHKSPHFSWESKITKTELLPILQKFAGRPLSTDFQLSVNEKAGNLVTALKVTAGDYAFFINEQLFRQAVGKKLGWQKLKSSTYAITDYEGTLIFNGHGLGHQVGLCQYGAQEMARRGYSAAKILKHYFPRLLIRKK